MHPPDAHDRFRPHAVRELAGMFDDVSPSYDLLNRLMSLGQDRAWRAALARAVPAEARLVLDLCTGGGASLSGLRRPGRLVLGMDASLGMLARAAAGHAGPGWAPRLACANAFHLPLRDAALDAVTVAFGMRNLRPRPAALAELARVIRPGGTLAVLEATAPAPGMLRPLHAFFLRRVVPALGRLSPDPSAYVYLGRSIFEFGSGDEFERDLLEAGFERGASTRFLLGATRLWVTRRRAAAGETRSVAAGDVQNASGWGAGRREMPQAASGREGEWRLWSGAQALVSAALFIALAYGLWVFVNYQDQLPLEPWQRTGMGWLLAGGALVFGARALVLLVRFLGPPPRA